ncbi:hypothetical protein UFOVP964_107 [uncultured Caudovirales phage]|uniref:Uncharacterized protein n=1 Tax=uncultured Caudovirales phage TaxID=2100421 RepID=A0A6J5PUX1_9CAUD|nr:hypothetical protein UFOVP854_107 [uncultured Caudovirales phage]CAB4174992.1 hypothetical protein UFOVP964_107 [uncultured Caudovirales phage]CAB4179258.1 hypothetical protein UFOVP1034_51 [uncultured Caudovirales phage]CAB4189095.1 hypothetical protein UFOVP1177_51 [uncultured Caudovirales phage]CAB4193201.1 hypothetical protein UFOVP1243_38 [uncultured Caudovirales phage]
MYAHSHITFISISYYLFSYVLDSTHSSLVEGGVRPLTPPLMRVKFLYLHK